MDQLPKNTAVIVGGSNGIGLAVGINLMEKGYYVEILDMCAPDEGLLRGFAGCYTYRSCNLLEFDSKMFEELRRNESVNLLMITAGIGRVADFEYLHTAEIEKVFRINAVSTIKILRIFYERIKSNVPFYCGVMGSIAGIVNSPMFSVYSASKAAICRFTESVNIELEAAGVKNRILNVSPGSIKGTRFNGGENDLAQTAQLAQSIVDGLLACRSLYIPQYEEIYHGIIEKNYRDPHQFGLESYNYKRESGRAQNRQMVVIGYLSGTFDLFHVGHVNLLRRAKAQCDYLIVGVHESGSWKGKETFIPLNERMEILAACKYVDEVTISEREDCDAWKIWHYNKLFVGSDYKGSERFAKYEDFFADKGVEIVYFPYTEGTSSTMIRKKISDMA